MGLKVLVADPISDQGVAVLRNGGGLHVDVQPGLSESELVSIIGSYDALIVRSGTQVTKEVIAAGTRLQVIGRAGVGVDNIDVDAATRRGIVVINAPEGNTLATAEHTIAMMFALARWIPPAHMSVVRDHLWQRQRFIGMQIDGKTLGVIGLGRIGSQVARRAQALGMNVIAFDPFISEERARKLGVTLADVDDVCRAAHVLTVHTPLTPATEGIVAREQFAIMQDGVRIINVARGGVIDEEALYEALQAGKVAGAALDVFSVEPPWDNPLLQHERVIVTPHIGALTVEAQINVAVDVAKEVVRALKGKPVRQAVNLPVVPRDMLEQMMPFVDLSERLGRIYTELIGGGQSRIEIVYSGQLAKLDSAPLTRAVLKGMLNPILQEAVNYVNASVVARERGLQVVETRIPDEGEFQSLITVRSVADDGTERMVAGTLTGQSNPALAFIDGYRVNVDTPGHLLIARNVDRPGMIGRVGTLLGENGINIAFMQVGRKEVGSHAVMVLGVDDPIPKSVMEQLDKVEDLWDTRVVKW